MLEKMALFDKLSDATLQLLEQRLLMRGVEKDAIVFTQGDISESMYIVRHGRARIWTVSSAGHEVTLNILEPGAVSGEIGFLDCTELQGPVPTDARGQR